VMKGLSTRTRREFLTVFRHSVDALDGPPITVIVRYRVGRSQPDLVAWAKTKNDPDADDQASIESNETAAPLSAYS